MKKTSLVIAVIMLATFFSVKATTIIIQAIGTTSANEGFSPEVANANCGDTIRWVLVSGTHTTASTSVPPGATTWASGNITTSGYIYVVTVAGTYNYTCHPANGGHMNASIVVQCTSDIPSLSDLGSQVVYPNPSNGKLIVDIKDNSECSFVVYNSVSEKMFESRLSGPVTETDVNLPNGIYYYQLHSESNLIGKGKLVIQK